MAFGIFLLSLVCLGPFYIKMAPRGAITKHEYPAMLDTTRMIPHDAIFALYLACTI